MLVSAASKHGATAEIAEHIGSILRDRGLDATVAPPAEVGSIEGYQAVVLGSAVYAGHWLNDAKDVAERIGVSSTRPAVWLFSSGPLGDPPRPDEEPVDVEDVHEATGAREHRIFAGRIDKSLLSFGEKAIMIAVRAPEGDFRDWAEIATWAEGIASSLQEEYTNSN